MLDKQISKRLITWLENRILNCDNPRLWGSALTGNKSGQWRYRIGDYRVVCEIQDDVLIVKVIKVAHRKEVYAD
jgi:mRNA interferase RelE/StbE